MFSCSGSHKSRLFIGEAGFKGVQSLLNKHKNSHPNLASAIVATELSTFGREDESCNNCDDLEREEMWVAANIANLFLNEAQNSVDYSQDSLTRPFFCSQRCERIKNIQDKGGTVILGFDGTLIHKSSHPAISGRTFQRIHWNCPHDKSNYHKQTLPLIISNFFKSASKVQNEGDQIHVTLAQPFRKESFYQGYVYDITNAAKSNDYFLYAKRFFGSDRYPGYDHEITGQESSDAGISRLREFVFKKGSASKSLGYRVGTFYGSQRGFYEVDTDEESSCYSDSESESS